MNDEPNPFDIAHPDAPYKPCFDIHSMHIPAGFIIRGRADGLEAEPVWEVPLPDGHAELVAGILEAVREDWRHSPAPESGYRLELEYIPATGAMDITMGPADPNEQPPAGLLAPLPFRRPNIADYWGEGPFDHEAAAAALPDDAAERIEAALGVDRPGPAAREEHQP